MYITFFGMAAVQVVLGYIQNNTKRLKMLVATRIHQIHES